MIQVKDFYNELLKNNINFFTGVPDSLLKDICAYITDNADKNRNIITANEGGAIGLACGYHLATNNIPLIYMQNSGIGNSVNPLLSLADKEVYSIPMLLMIGWRGEPDIKDEPQHVKQGRITLNLLDAMEIPYIIIDGDSDFISDLTEILKICKKESKPVALLIRKNTFGPYKLQNIQTNTSQLSREETLENILSFIPENSVIVSTTGMLSRELFEIREKIGGNHSCDFLTVGSMGHASQIALGIAIAKPNINVFCFDGDGALLMHLGSIGIIGSVAPQNFKHIVFNNGSHDSVGGQPTIALEINLVDIAKSVNYKYVNKVISSESLKDNVSELCKEQGPGFLEIQIKKGSRKDLGRPTSTPFENKLSLMNELMKR